MLERASIAVEFWWYLPPWERDKDFIPNILAEIGKGATLEDLISEYEREV